MEGRSTQRDLLQNVEKLQNHFREARPDQRQVIADMARRVKEGMIREKLYESPIIQDLVETLSGVVNGINARLQTERSDKLSDPDRDRLLDQRDLYQMVIQTFTYRTLEQTTQEIEATLKANNLPI